MNCCDKLGICQDKPGCPMPKPAQVAPIKAWAARQYDDLDTPHDQPAREPMSRLEVALIVVIFCLSGLISVGLIAAVALS